MKGVIYIKCIIMIIIIMIIIFTTYKYVVNLTEYFWCLIKTEDHWSLPCIIRNIDTSPLEMFVNLEWSRMSQLVNKKIVQR